MKACERRCGVSVILLAAITSVTACSGSGSATVPEAVATVVSSDPANGASGVAPTADITFELADNGARLQAADVVISDGGNELPGTLSQIGTTTTWVWSSEFELPRGCTIQALVHGQAVTTFSIRDFTRTAEFELLGEAADQTLSWPNGRRVVTTMSGRVFEVSASGLMELFIDIPANARTFGDGSFLGETVDSGVRYCTRGNLDGSSDRVPTPYGVSIGDSNANGDVVVLVPNTLGSPTDWGLWRLMRTDLMFTFAGSRAISDGHPAIHTDGTVAIAYTNPGLALALFAVGDVVGVEHTTHEWYVGSLLFHFGGDGQGLLTYSSTQGVAEGLRVLGARYKPEVGLVPLPEVLRDWSGCGGQVGCSLAAANSVVGVVVGEYGSACVQFVENVSTPPEHHFVRRVAADDQVEPLVTYRTTAGVEHVSPRRAELWAMSRPTDPSQLELVRSRPDGSASSTVYEVPVGGMPLSNWSFAFDDSGRAVVALTEGSGTSMVMRVLFLE